jgi:UDP-N-acetyl-D-glucosamine dehydrogenase
MTGLPAEPGSRSEAAGKRSFRPPRHLHSLAVAEPPTQDSIAQGTKVGIVGLGYVGLPLAVAFAEQGVEVVGLDVDPARVEALGLGESYVEDVPDSALAALGGSFTATTEYGELAAVDTIVVCVPTPLTDSREPDLSYLEAAGRALAGVIREGQTVILESTTYPGTTREVLGPLLEESGLEAGRDFHLAFSPERIDPGRTDYTIRTTPKLVGGIDPESTESAARTYGLICDEVVRLSGPDAAELAKLLENVFRSVNIALVNELAQLCERLDIDVWEVVDAASTKPFGFMRFDPGPGMGGHCLPIDPFYLAFRAKQYDFPPEFVELAGKINQSQPEFCVSLAERVLNDAGLPVKGSKVLVLGVAYKPGVGDTRESPAIRIISMLEDLGSEVSFHDPHVEVLGKGRAGVPLEPALGEADLAIIVTAHPEFDPGTIVEGATRVLDLRGVTRHLGADNVTLL